MASFLLDLDKDILMGALTFFNDNSQDMRVGQQDSDSLVVYVIRVLVVESVIPFTSTKVG